jgi:hypothetical protein
MKKVFMEFLVVKSNKANSSSATIVSELLLIRLCRTEPVAPALSCADLVAAASRRRVLILCGWRPFVPSQRAERLHTSIPVALRAHMAAYW